MSRVFKGFALALSMLSTLPFFKVHDFYKGINGYAVMFYPFVGFILGAILYGVSLFLFPYFWAFCSQRALFRGDERSVQWWNGDDIWCCFSHPKSLLAYGFAQLCTAAFGAASSSFDGSVLYLLFSLYLRRNESACKRGVTE